MPRHPDTCARCGHPVARYQSPVQAHSASGTVTWCSDACAAADGWPDDIGAVARVLARIQSPSEEPAVAATSAAPDPAALPTLPEVEVPPEAAAIPPEAASRRVAAAGGSPTPTPRIAAMPRQELRISINVPLAGDLFDQAPIVAKVGAALDAFRAALAEASVDATISHEVVTPRPRGARA